MKYKKFSDYTKAVKKDFKSDIKDWRDSNTDFRVETLMARIANFILILSIIYALTKLLGQHIEFVRNYFEISMPLVWLSFEKIREFTEKIFQFQALERFRISELNEFDFEASLGLYFCLLAANAVIIAVLAVPQLWPWIQSQYRTYVAK